MPAYRLASSVSLLCECVGERKELEERREEGGKKQREKDEIEDRKSWKGRKSQEETKEAEND